MTQASTQTAAKPVRSADYLGATGIGVSDLDHSVDFYTRVLGMTKAQTFNLAHMNEVVVSYPGRTAIVLMHFIDGSNPNYKNLPIKLVFYVTDPKAVAERIRAEGLEITREPTPVPEFGGAMVCLAKDPDGYVIELLQAPNPK